MTKKYKLKLFAFATALWVLWTVRNIMVIEGVFLSDQLISYPNSVPSLQKWWGRLEPDVKSN
jgi:hypothetical protein